MSNGGGLDLPSGRPKVVVMLRSLAYHFGGPMTYGTIIVIIAVIVAIAAAAIAQFFAFRAMDKALSAVQLATRASRRSRAVSKDKAESTRSGQ